MSDVLSTDYNMMSSALSSDEVALLKQYQQLARNLADVKNKLNHINGQISEIHDPDFDNLTFLSSELQKNISVLGTAFKSTVHNILLQMDSNPVNIANIHNNYASTVDEAEKEQEAKAGNDSGEYDALGNQVSDNADLGSSIDEDPMETVDRINEELGISQEEADIHRQIAHQLESSAQATDS